MCICLHTLPSLCCFYVQTLPLCVHQSIIVLVLCISDSVAVTVANVATVVTHEMEADTHAIPGTPVIPEIHIVGKLIECLCLGFFGICYFCRFLYTLLHFVSRSRSPPRRRERSRYDPAQAILAVFQFCLFEFILAS